jgi:hypothetical protein
MKYKSWIVSKEDERPAGNKGECFYCNEKIGVEHKKGCVCRQRSVVVNFNIDLVLPEPEDWDENSIDFFYNEGSWCGNNFIGLLEDLEKRLGDNGCLCRFLKASFIREATKEDEENQKFSIKSIS